MSLLRRFLDYWLPPIPPHLLDPARTKRVQQAEGDVRQELTKYQASQRLVKREAEEHQKVMRDLAAGLRGLTKAQEAIQSAEAALIVLADVKRERESQPGE